MRCVACAVNKVPTSFECLSWNQLQAWEAQSDWRTNIPSAHVSSLSSSGNNSQIFHEQKLILLSLLLKYLVKQTRPAGNTLPLQEEAWLGHSSLHFSSLFSFQLLWVLYVMLLRLWLYQHSLEGKQNDHVPYKDGRSLLHRFIVQCTITLNTVITGF